VERHKVLSLFFKRERLLSDSKLLGRWGEKRSEKYLKRKGLKTLSRNFLCKTGEIDLVMVDQDGAIVFVEVKTRADESFADAETAATTEKQKRLFRAAKYFLSANNITHRPYRFDFVTVVLAKKGSEKIQHYKNAFVP
jgi:putative endonuclease